MGQVTFKTYQQIYARMRNRVVARSDLTDLLPTSSLAKVLDAAAREDDDQYFQMRKVMDSLDLSKVYGRDLDDLAKIYNPNVIPRRLGVKTTGNVVFSRVSTVGNVTIPIGTRIKTPSGGLVFITTQVGTILSGSQSSGFVPVEAEKFGTQYKIDANTLTSFDSKPSGVDSVTNGASFTNGEDVESDESYRQRIRIYQRSLSRSTVNSVESAALGVTDSVSGKTVTFAQLVESAVLPGRATLYIDDGTGTAESSTHVTGGVILAAAQGGEQDVYIPSNQIPVKVESAYTIFKNASPIVEGTDYTINPSSGQIRLTTPLTVGNSITGNWDYFTGLIQEVQKVIDGVPSNRVDYPGYRAAGMWIRVITPQISNQVFQANITVKQGFDQVAIATKVASAVSGYINSLGIGEDVIHSELTKRCMAIPGMFDIVIFTPTANVTILSSQLARITTGNIQVS